MLASLAHDSEGMAWFSEKVAAMNRVLQENNLPTFTEPEKLPQDARGEKEFYVPVDFADPIFSDDVLVTTCRERCLVRASACCAN